MKTIQASLQDASQQLQESPSTPNSTPRVDAEALLSWVLHKNKAFLYAHSEQLLTEEQYQNFTQLVAQRQKGYPIAYLTGHKEFWSLELQVNEHTLIPRPETELLVELALKFLPADEPLQLLDLGTGSGAIALALGKERPKWSIIAVDKSPEALDIAKANAQRLAINNVEFRLMDWYEDFPQEIFHAILSNPPYIAENDEHLNQGDLRFEPQSALMSGQDGLQDIQYLVQTCFNKLHPQGWLILEHGYNQRMIISSILSQMGYTEVQCWQDCQGNDRVSCGKRTKN